MRPPVILHADLDAFYASVEQRDHPELRGRPVLVGGPGPRGVVAAASYEARRFGIRSAMPMVEARRRCPDAVVLPGDMAKYRRIGAEVREIFGSVSSLVEPLSVDEAFVDVTGSTTLLGPPLAIGRLLKARVRETTGLAVSVGIGPGKMVAKLASELSKPDGLLEVPPDAVRAFLALLPVGRLFGVGPRTDEALRRAALVTVADLAAADPRVLRAAVGARAAASLQALARGEDERIVEPDREVRSYGEESTFERDVADDHTARRAILAHADAVARRLRHDGVVARTVVLRLKLARSLGAGRFPLVTRQAPLPAPTADGQRLAEVALALWTAHRPAEPVRLLGVVATGIAPADAGQLALFPDRRARLNAALDALAARFGPDAVGRAVDRPAKASPSARVKRGEP